MCCVFTLQKSVIRILSDVGAKSSCRNLFKKLDILPAPCQYIFSLMLFVVDNQKHFQIKLSIRGLDTRNKNRLYVPIVNLSCFQRCVSYCAMNIFNSPPTNNKNLRNDRMKFKLELHKCLTTHSSYSLAEFFEHNANNAHN
jgi:hypothetical protein